MAQPGHGVLTDDARRSIEELLAGPDAEAARLYPGDDGSRQPAHTVYVPGDRYAPELTTQWGSAARAALQDGGGIEHLLEAHGLVPDAAECAVIGAQVLAKLEREPVEDLRIDFEDGNGDRGDAAEDDAVVAAARAVAVAGRAGQLPPYVGIRFKCFEPSTRARGLRTLDLFVTELARDGDLPDGLVPTLRKVTTIAQVQAMVLGCEHLERSLALAAGRLRFEIQVETPEAILGPDGTALIAPMLHAGAGRVSGLHYGTYDYSASLGIAAAYQSMAYQSMEHPAADHAKAVMQLAAAGTGVRISDGSTNVIPLGEPDAVDRAWAPHGRLVTRSLERGFYQGLDLHPAHLPSRFAATYAFFRASLPDVLGRLGADVAGREGAVLDEPATARSMAWFVLRGLDCGAVGSAEVTGASTGRSWSRWSDPSDVKAAEGMPELTVNGEGMRRRAPQHRRGRAPRRGPDRPAVPLLLRAGRVRGHLPGRVRWAAYVPGEQRADGSLTSHRPRRLHDHLLRFQQVENRLHDTESTCSASGSPTSQTRTGRPTRTSDPDERSAPR